VKYLIIKKKKYIFYILNFDKFKINNKILILEQKNQLKNDLKFA